jgi:predicted esterase
MGGSISSFYNSNIAWADPSTNLRIPAMNINPDMITVTGFSGGAHFAGNLVVIHSETFAGGGMVAGGPFSAGYYCSAGNYERC